MINQVRKFDMGVKFRENVGVFLGEGEMAKERFHNLDLLKVIAMVMVVSLHAGTWHVNFLENPSPSVVLQYGARLLSEGVPIFVMVNGYLLFVCMAK